MTAMHDERVNGAKLPELSARRNQSSEQFSGQPLKVRRRELSARRNKPSRDFLTIEMRRKALGISVQQLAAAAGISIRTYQRARAGVHGGMHEATIIRLAAALDRGGIPSPKVGAATKAIACLHRLTMAHIAAELGLDCEGVLATDFSHQRPANKAWLTAARVRREALVILVLDVGVPPAAVARALCVTNQNVWQAVRQGFELEDVQEIGARHARLARILNGG